MFCVGLGNSPGIAVALAHPVEFSIGIDIKTVSADKADGLIGEMSISDAERARLDDANESLEIACGVLWTAREALAKMLKVGLSVPLNILSLGNIRAVDSGNGVSQCRTFLHCQCLSQAFGGHVMSIAMHAQVEVQLWPGAV